MIVDRTLFCRTDCVPKEKKIEPAGAHGGLVPDARTVGPLLAKHCVKCKESIWLRSYAVYLGLPFHRDCLRCECCARQLTIGDLAIVDANKLVFCRFPCYERKVVRSGL